MTSSTLVAMTTSPASFADNPYAARVASNLAQVRARIESTGRASGEVRVVAVTKTFGIDAVRAAAAVGLSDVGENYVAELEEKRAASAVPLRWHYLGALQSNKISRICRVADVVCGVSRESELERIASSRADTVIYVQVDYTGVVARNGASPRDVAQLVRRARALELDVRGLMCVAPPEALAAREAFAKTTRLADEFALVERSMGMTDDLEIACELGSTEIRVGRALFGARVVTSPLT
jgi:uncharacterized pyridoxal phosphate-containing UPF0001 family protein